jgi:hypothetical protein
MCLSPESLSHRKTEGGVPNRSSLTTKTRGKVREPLAPVIEAIPNVVPVGVCFRVEYTVTFAAAKQGLIGHEELTGELIVADIGMARICLKDDEWVRFKGFAGE